MRERSGLVIPVVIIIALVLGVLRLHWATLVIPVGIWIVLLLTAGDPTVSRGELAIGGGLLALFNALPGYGLGRGIRTLVETVRNDVSDHLAATRAQEGDAP